MLIFHSENGKGDSGIGRRRGHDGIPPALPSPSSSFQPPRFLHLLLFPCACANQGHSNQIKPNQSIFSNPHARHSTTPILRHSAGHSAFRTPKPGHCPHFIKSNPCHPTPCGAARRIFLLRHGGNPRLQQINAFSKANSQRYP
jgi:hypothetical protein